MAQPTVPVSDDRRDLAGLPPFWTKPSLSPPYSWDSWFGQFSLALGIKDSFNVSDIAVEPGDVHDDPLLNRSLGRTQQESDDRLRRDAAARRRAEEANAERRKKSPRIGMNWFFHEAEARARSSLFFAIGNEGRKKLVQAFPHADLNRLSFGEFFKNCIYAFKVEVNVTIERIKLYNSWYMEANESFCHFTQNCCQNISLKTEQEERSVVRDLFIGRISDSDVQSTLIRKKISMPLEL